MKAKKILLSALTALLAVLVAAAILLKNPPVQPEPIKTGWQEDGGARFYFSDLGEPLTGWQEIDGARRFFGSDGVMQTGWLTDGGSTYYLDADGAMVTGNQTLDGNVYCFTAAGNMLTGWHEDRFYDTDGVMQTGWLTEGDHTYYLGSDGIMQTGRLELDGSVYLLGSDGAMLHGWQEPDTGRAYFGEDGAMLYGWQDIGGESYYLGENGSPVSGWQDIGENRYYFDESGIMQTGWLTEGGKTYYLTGDGTPAKGRIEIDGTACFFTADGTRIQLVNRWNPIPEDYAVELKKLDNGRNIASECYDALVQMVADCTAAGCHPEVIGANRTRGDQQALFSNKLKAFTDKGLSSSEAYAKTVEAVAVPGTSEHELGLAVDILDKYYPKKYTGDDNCMVWLSEHCWEYGFIIRYPDDKTQITGTKFEPWHYRYVGVELAMELKDSGLCLEEYIDSLTEYGTTCGNPEA